MFKNVNCEMLKAWEVSLADDKPLAPTLSLT